MSRCRWMERAACRDSDPGLFFDKNFVREAKEVCARCGVRETCLEHALAVPEQEGVWGGTTPGRRERIRKNRLRLAGKVAA